MKDLRNFKKAELIEILVEEFGYEKADLKNKVNIELKEMIQKEEQFSKKEEQKQSGIATFEDDRIVLVMSGTSGRVSYDSDVTHKSYVWMDHGDLQNMQYKELAEIKRRHPRFLDDGWLFIIDDDVRTQLGQADDMFVEPQKLEQIFELPTIDMIKEIDKYKGSAFEVIANVSWAKCKTGKINDLAKMRVLAHKFGYEVEDLIM